MPKNEAKNKQNQEIVGNTERKGERVREERRVGDSEKLNPDNIIWVYN